MDDGATPFFAACEQGRVDVVRVLPEAGECDTFKAVDDGATSHHHSRVNIMMRPDVITVRCSGESAANDRALGSGNEGRTAVITSKNRLKRVGGRFPCRVGSCTRVAEVGNALCRHHRNARTAIRRGLNMQVSTLDKRELGRQRQQRHRKRHTPLLVALGFHTAAHCSTSNQELAAARDTARLRNVGGGTWPAKRILTVSNREADKDRSDLWLGHKKDKTLPKAAYHAVNSWSARQGRAGIVKHVLTHLEESGKRPRILIIPDFLYIPSGAYAEKFNKGMAALIAKLLKMGGKGSAAYLVSPTHDGVLNECREMIEVQLSKPELVAAHPLWKSTMDWRKKLQGRDQTDFDKQLGSVVDGIDMPLNSTYKSPAQSYTITLNEVPGTPTARLQPEEGCVG